MQIERIASHRFIYPVLQICAKTWQIISLRLEMVCETNGIPRGKCDKSRRTRVDRIPLFRMTTIALPKISVRLKSWDNLPGVALRINKQIESQKQEEQGRQCSLLCRTTFCVALVQITPWQGLRTTSCIFLVQFGVYSSFRSAQQQYFTWIRRWLGLPGSQKHMRKREWSMNLGARISKPWSESIT